MTVLIKVQMYNQYSKIRNKHSGQTPFLIKQIAVYLYGCLHNQTSNYIQMNIKTTFSLRIDEYRTSGRRIYTTNVL